MKNTCKWVALTLVLLLAPCFLAPGLLPEARAAGVIAGTQSEVDDSQASLGIIKVRYTGGDGAKLKVRILNASNAAISTTDLPATGSFSTYTITAGAGAYTIKVLKQLAGNQYTVIQTVAITVASGGATASAPASSSAPAASQAPAAAAQSDLASDPRFAPYLVSNSTVVYTSSSAAVKKAGELCSSSKTDLEKLSAVFKYITDNITYDYDKMNAVINKQIPSSYVPDVDTILSAKKGICFDYAALLAAMLRSQGVPTKLIKGYCTVQGRVYHAWNEVYIQGTGWVKIAGSFYFDGKNYQTMDSTYSAADKKYDLKTSNYERTKEY